MPPEEDWATSTAKMRSKFGDVWTDMLVHRLTDMLILFSPTGVEYLSERFCFMEPTLALSSFKKRRLVI